MSEQKISVKKLTASRYEGGNDRLDTLLAEYWPDEVWYMVNGPHGRRPIEAATAEEAKRAYADKYSEVYNPLLHVA